MVARFVRVAEQHRRIVEFEIDGIRCDTLEGDILLVALLTQMPKLRQSEFGYAVQVYAD